MNTRHYFSYFKFTRSQRNGLLGLFALIVLMQFALAFADFSPVPDNDLARAQWLALQPKFDSLARIKPRRFERKPFNPNFITDFKGYRLGMSVAEIDRLLAFRQTGRYVNSAAEFQKVTRVSDSLLAELSPWFKFPEWVTQKKAYAKNTFEKPMRPVRDINAATAEDLKAVYGIGDGLSRRILDYREKLGGFVSMEQMDDVWGLSAEVVRELHAGFKVVDLPSVKKIAINEASVRELSQFPYFRYQVAKSIVTYRSMHGRIANVEDLFKISEFPVEKMKIIALYLDF